MPENLRVLEMDVVDLVGEFARGRHRVHELPHQVRRIELQAHVRAVLEGFEQRLPAHRPGGDVRPAGVGLPQDAHLVLLAGGEVLFGVNLDDLIHLPLQLHIRDGAALPADVGDAKFAAQIQAFEGVGVLALAFGGVWIDVVSVHGQRGNVDAALGDIVLDGGDGGIVQLVGIEPQLRAGKAFGFDELQVGIRVLHQNAEPGFPVRRAVALRLGAGGRGHGGKNGASRDGHEMTILRKRAHAQAPSRSDCRWVPSPTM